MRRGAVPIPADFAQPADMAGHNAKVFNGEYDAPHVDFAYKAGDSPVVVDIGACCGAFAMWALRRYGQGTYVYSFEPNPTAMRYLQSNRDIAATLNWRARAVGVRAEAGRYALYDGLHNLGEASMHDIGEQQTDGALFVDCISAGDLPCCDVLKVDTEGCELEIVGRYLEKVCYPRVVCLEWHRASDFRALQAMMFAGNYALVRGTIECEERGTAVWVRK